MNDHDIGRSLTQRRLTLGLPPGTGDLAATLMVAGAAEDRKPRVLGESGIARGAFAEKEDGTTGRLDAAPVGAIRAQARERWRAGLLGWAAHKFPGSGGFFWEGAGCAEGAAGGVAGAEAGAVGSPNSMSPRIGLSSMFSMLIFCETLAAELPVSI